MGLPIDFQKDDMETIIRFVYDYIDLHDQYPNEESVDDFECEKAKWFDLFSFIDELEKRADIHHAGTIQNDRPQIGRLISYIKNAEPRVKRSCTYLPIINALIQRASNKDKIPLKAYRLRFLQGLPYREIYDNLRGNQKSKPETKDQEVSRWIAHARKLIKAEIGEERVNQLESLLRDLPSAE